MGGRLPASGAQFQVGDQDRLRQGSVGRQFDPVAEHRVHTAQYQIQQCLVACPVGKDIGRSGLIVPQVVFEGRPAFNTYQPFLDALVRNGQTAAAPDELCDSGPP